MSVPMLGCALMAMNLSYGYKIYVPIEQPVQFSHKHHVQDDGIDCRYCHTTVDKSTFAGLPPTETCMTCHSQIWSDSPELKPVQDSFKSGKPLQWNRVHDLPDHAYFNHAIHINKGVGCESCHGRIDEMPLVKKVHLLNMAWCVDCHRDPRPALRPKDQVYEMGWTRNESTPSGDELFKQYKILPPEQLTNCSICHR
jgi:hypothetical protein